jgi:hypothetical protein
MSQIKCSVVYTVNFNKLRSTGVSNKSLITGDDSMDKMHVATSLEPDSLTLGFTGTMWQLQRCSPHLISNSKHFTPI